MRARQVLTRQPTFPRMGVAFAYVVLTCEKIKVDQDRLHVRADGAGHRRLGSRVRLVH